MPLTVTHGWCYAYWLAVDCMHDRLIGMEVPWGVCVCVLASVLSGRGWY
jgi:hypothetical protein